MFLMFPQAQILFIIKIFIKWFTHDILPAFFFFFFCCLYNNIKTEFDMMLACNSILIHGLTSNLLDVKSKI